MTTRRCLRILAVVVTIGLGAAAGYASRAMADKPTAAAPAGTTAPAGTGKAPAGGAIATAPLNCKAFNGSKCCDPTVTAHLPKETVFKACGKSDATYLGEVGSKETCKYVFKVEGEKDDETFVQVYAPAQKEVPSSPNDPFFQWKKVGKAYLTEKAKSPKAAPMIANSTGLWMPGKGYFVSLNVSTKVCTKAQATKLAPGIK